MSSQQNEGDGEGSNINLIVQDKNTSSLDQMLKEVSSNFPNQMDSSIGNEINLDELEFEGNDQDEEIGENNSSKKRKKIESRSIYWVHFDKFICPEEKIRKGRCKYCKVEIKADSKQHGTKGLKSHFNACKLKPHEVATNQSRLNLQKTIFGDERDSCTPLWKYDEVKIRKALCTMIIIDELPFKHVENVGFKYFMSVALPQFTIPCRKTLAKEIYQMYLDEKIVLKNLLKESSQRVSITTDTWTSIQNINYMVLTVHWIDNKWKLQIFFLNFCTIGSHKGEEIGKSVEKCIREWGIENIFSVTVDNASSNDGAVRHLKRRMTEVWKTNILDNEHVHMRCIAHIINLVVQDGLKESDEHKAIECVRAVVRYIRSSPARYKSFVESVDYEKLDTNKLLCLDVPTRWNSTFLMLEAASTLQKAFSHYKENNKNFDKDLRKPSYGGGGAPTYLDWERVKLLLKFLGHFYDLTLRISGSLYVTSNLVFHEISAVEILLNDYLNSDDIELKAMAGRMKEKFDKYWGNFEKMNKILYYAVILDPRHKMEFLSYSFNEMYSEDKSEEMRKNILDGMSKLFEDYKRKYDHARGVLTSVNSSTSSVSMPPRPDSERRQKTYLRNEFKKLKKVGSSVHVKSELERYLSDETEDDDDDSFDILAWWKINAHRYPVLAQIAQDVLAVPVSTVASEAAFSTGGRVLDAFRSSLLPTTVQAHICAQDWLRGSTTPVSVEEDLYEVDRLEKELSSMNITSNSTTTSV